MMNITRLLGRLMIMALILFITGCNMEKEYTVEIRAVCVYEGMLDSPSSGKIFPLQIKAENDDVAAEFAYYKYLRQICLCCADKKEGRAYLRIPVDYQILDKKGNLVSRNLKLVDPHLERSELIYDEEVVYYKLVGYAKYKYSPLGIRHPRPEPESLQEFYMNFE